MIEEYYYKPNLVPPFSFFVYVYWIFRKLKEKCRQCNIVFPKCDNGSTNKNELNENEVSRKEQNFISNWTNTMKFYG